MSSTGKNKYNCRYCLGSGWITPGTPEERRRLDDIDQMLVRIMGHENIRKICPVCHGTGTTPENESIGGGEYF